MVPLKFKVDRKTLEIMYHALVLPTMEYGNVIWGGTYDSDMLKLERIHVDAMRLVTGATARSNIANLYLETGWQSIIDRRNNAMLVMLYKIKNNIAPEYLQELIPPENHEYIRYNLRNNSDIAVPPARLETYRRSFVPHSISLWNQLSIHKRDVASVEEFKTAILEKTNCNILYYYGKRWPSIHHARMRIGCSKLKSDLYNNLHVIDNPVCDCGQEEENAIHFFLNCQNYTDIRLQLFNTISAYSHVNIEVILNGNPIINEGQNQAIFDAVHYFIEQSNRFI